MALVLFPNAINTTTRHLPFVSSKKDPKKPEKMKKKWRYCINTNTHYPKKLTIRFVQETFQEPKKQKKKMALVLFPNVINTTTRHLPSISSKKDQKNLKNKKNGVSFVS